VREKKRLTSASLLLPKLVDEAPNTDGMDKFSGHEQIVMIANNKPQKHQHHDACEHG
jgi:hypothetical protein